MARRGSFVAKNVVMMPSFVNIGAYVDEGTMVDTGSPSVRARRSASTCTYPAASASVACSSHCRPNPTIIEDNCFIGARSEIVEGVIVEANSVVSMGVYISQSTRSMTAPPAKSATGAYRQARSSSPATCRRRRQIQSLLRGDRQEGRRWYPRQDGNQRAASRLAPSPQPINSPTFHPFGGMPSANLALILAAPI